MIIAAWPCITVEGCESPCSSRGNWFGVGYEGCGRGRWCQSTDGQGHLERRAVGVSRVESVHNETGTGVSPERQGRAINT
jgi:hypothetical protein